MAKGGLTERDRRRIDAAVERFVESRGLFESFTQALMAYFQADARLAQCTQFIKYRIKAPDHLRQKLVRKALQGEMIDATNLFDRVTDLAGIRIIHLHTEQMREIHTAILEILREYQLPLVEPPTANCWDVEYEKLFAGFGIATRSMDTMYTTVHYVIQANQRTKVTCEVQVRTLMDEVWGEVSHRVNYPNESPSRTCQDQLKVLARLTSGCTRLVDSIFRSHLEASKPES
jgi:putative GTP pyrophosphokinase